MDNASKALYMAGSLLIALLVISLLVYAFSNIGGLQDEVDTIESEEEITAFNTEYEAFNKKIMYGVDVISCINKVINHDEKYVKGTIANPKYGMEALIDVKVNLKDNKLKESIEVYHFDENGRERKYYIDSDIPVEKIKNSYESIRDKLPNGMPKDDWDELVNNEEIFKELGNGGALLKNSDFPENDDTSLYKLVGRSNEIEIVIENPDEDEKTNVDGWSYIKLTTYLADFKKRKFCCESMKYSEKTGLVNEIVFSEK